jgi:putative ABC transport system permease protein
MSTAANAAESQAKHHAGLGLGGLLRLASRFLWRDLRGGELKLLTLSLIMAVCSVTAIALFTDRLERALLNESANMLAADRVLSGRQAPPRDWLLEAQQRGLQTGEFISFASMVFSDQGNILVSAKAVSPSYPLRGDLLVADEPFGNAYISASGPAPGTVWVESRVMPALGISVGDPVYVGNATLTVSQVLVQEPDRQQGGMMENAGPRLLMNLNDVPATGIIQPGSRVSYRYLFAGDLSLLDDFSQWLDEQPDNEYRLRDVREESEEVSEALDRAESFLMLGSLFAVTLAGLAIALTARRYSHRHFDHVAILKTLGLTASQINLMYGLLLGILWVVAVLLGSILGWLIHEAILAVLASLMQVALPAASVTPFFIGAITALLCLAAFALPPLWGLRRVSPLRVLRKDVDLDGNSQWLPYSAGVGGILALILWYSRDLYLTAVIASAVVLVFAALALASYLLLRSGTASGMRAGSAWLLAKSALRRRSQQSVLQIMVFAVTFMSLLTLSLLRSDLISDWQAQLPEDTPNHFMMNITAAQLPGIDDFYQQENLSGNPFYPMMRAALLTVNGEPARRPWDEDDQPGNLTERAAENTGTASLNGDDVTVNGDEDVSTTGEGEGDSNRRPVTRQVTWTSSLPPENEVVAGQWWFDEARPGEVSVELDYAERLDLELGDELIFEIEGQQVPVRVSSFRTVRWDNMQPNFFFIFSPGTLEQFGATYLSTLLLEGEQKLLLNDLLRSFPTIVVLEVDAIIAQIQRIIFQVSSAIELIAALVLISGALVLLACVNATLGERYRENAILRTLGASRQLILRAMLFEYAFIGAISGTMATIGAEAALYFLQTQVFEQAFALHIWVWLAGPVLGTVLIAGVGFAATRRVVNTSPLLVLRQLAD